MKNNIVSKTDESTNREKAEAGSFSRIQKATRKLLLEVIGGLLDLV